MNAVSPAVVETPIYSSFIPEDKIRSTLESFHSFHPIGRIGKTNDIAEDLLFALRKSGLTRIEREDRLPTIFNVICVYLYAHG